MKPLIAAAAALIAAATPAQAQYNFYLVNDAQMVTNEVISWIQAGNSEKACAALAKAEALSSKLSDNNSMEAATKAQIASLRPFTLKMSIYCPAAF